MKPSSKIILLLVAGPGAFLAAAQWSRQGADAPEEADIVGPVTRTRTAAASAAASASSMTGDSRAASASRRVPGGGTQAFEALSWVPTPPPPPPPPPRPAPPPPAAPVAPPLPFTFVGMVERGADRPQAYLAKGEVLLVVGAGDVIENRTYRVDSIAASGVVLTYLPLGKQQTVNVPGGTP